VREPHFTIGKLDIVRPIFQAPIGSLGTAELVATVSNAGGVGTLALSWSDAEIATKLITAVKTRTLMPFAANFVLSFKTSALNAALESGVPIVTFSWGLPGPLVGTVHSYGAAVGVQVGTVSGARRAIDEGCDFIICQGVEAGGHVQSSIPLRTLLPAVVAEAREVPVVAAGGLADGADVAEVIALGACAAMLGTRFVASAESRAHHAYKAALLSAGAADTALTGCFDGGWPYALHRVLRNATLTNWESSGCPPSGSRPGEADVVAQSHSGGPVRRYDDTPPNNEMEGDTLSCCLYAGTGIEKIVSIQSADTLVKDIWRDAASIGRAVSAPSGARRG
jgi:nitronate monooxygenase